MASPGVSGIDVITAALRQEAGTWDGEAAEMGKIGPKAEGLRFNHDSVLFQMIFDACGEVIDQVIARSNEGQQRMTEVGSTLRTVADKYDEVEAANAERLRRVGGK
jgi:hypothetical protein